MGFYATAQIVRDSRDHGFEVRPVDVNASDWDCALEEAPGGRLALRLGLRQVEGLDSKAPGVLARADAFGSAGLCRRQALRAVKALSAPPPPLFAALEEPFPEPKVILPAMGLGEEVVSDYRALSLSLKAHPLALLRAELATRGIQPAGRLSRLSGRASVAGLVLIRQRPGTASGVVFVTLEDETATANVIVWPQAFERFRQVVMTASLLRVDGKVQRDGTVIHLVAERLEDLEDRLIRQAVEGCGGNLSQAARQLGLSRPQLAYRYRKMAEE